MLTGRNRTSTRWLIGSTFAPVFNDDPLWRRSNGPRSAAEALVVSHRHYKCVSMVNNAEAAAPTRPILRTDLVDEWTPDFSSLILLDGSCRQEAQSSSWQQKHVWPEGELIGHMPDVFQYKTTSWERNVERCFLLCSGRVKEVFQFFFFTTRLLLLFWNKNTTLNS